MTPDSSEAGPLKTDRPNAESRYDLAAKYASADRSASLRRALKDARRRNDAPSVALLVRWLSEEMGE
jgi:hypothetical protein